LRHISHCRIFDTSLTGTMCSTGAVHAGGERLPQIIARHEEITRMAKKSINATDKYVGTRVRMRRLMVGMTQSELGEAIGITFQQVQKYEKGTNRISASRLQEISDVLQVSVPFFFEGAPHVPGQAAANGASPSPAYVTDFLASTQGLALTKAFMQIKRTKLKQRILDLVKEIAGDEGD
jgi:transcriptional regulator with XRE-family HTH domain